MLKRLPSFSGKPLLYLVVTPLGNLSDIPERTREVLSSSTAIYSEDTRNAAKLLSHLSIKGKKLYSIRSQNEREEAPKAIARLLQEGGVISYMSDAGHPCLSDPGLALVREAIANDVAVSIVPATSAALSAYCLSGIESPRFYFQGFLPLKGKERASSIAAMKDRKEATIVYEAANRILKTMQDIAEQVGPDREISLSREISKLHEETIHGTVGDFLLLEEGEIRGEIAFVVAGNPNDDKKREIDLDAFMRDNLELGKAAVKKAVDELGVARKEAYSAYLRVREN